MASERQSQQEGNDGNRQVPGIKSKRKHGDGGLKLAEIRAYRNMMSGQSMNDLGLCLEPLLRNVVREELRTILERHQFTCCGAPINQTGKSGGRALQLCFTNKLHPTIFTRSKIISEDGAPLGIALHDASSHNCVVNEGPLSSTKIVISVLNGEFGSNGSEDWTAQEFDANISTQRQSKGPLLDGDRFITLENGVGFITNIEFTDNSCWTRSRRFRLGAKVMQPSCSEANIKEGRSEPFVVKDKRGESYKKHDRPSLSDEIWRLRKIAKDGKIHQQLSSHEVNTVKDLLQLYITNPTSLREKIGNIARKSWDTIIEHAKACDVDDSKHYIYHYYPTTEQPIALLFNSIYKLVEVIFDGQNYRSLESLNSEESRLVERAKQKAYENVKDLIPLETSTHSLAKMKTLAGVEAEQCDAPNQGQPGFCQPSTSTSHIGTDQLPELVISGMDIDGNGSHVQFASYLSPPSPWELGNIFDFLHGDGAEFSYHSSFPNSSKGKRKTFWNKIRNALKLVKLYVAKRNAKLSPITIKL